MRDADDFASNKRVVACHAIIADDRPVAAVKISQDPMAFGQKDLGVMSAAPFILDDDLICGSPTDGYGPTLNQTKNVGPFRAFTDNQVGEHTCIIVQLPISDEGR